MTLDKELIRKIDEIIAHGFVEAIEDYAEETEKSFDDDEIKKLITIALVNSEIVAFRIVKLLEKGCSGNG